MEYERGGSQAGVVFKTSFSLCAWVSCWRPLSHLNTQPPSPISPHLDTHFLPIAPSRILGCVKGSVSEPAASGGSVTGEWDMYKSLSVGPKTFPYENVSPQVSGGMGQHLSRRARFLLWISSVSMLPHPKPQVWAWPGLLSQTHPGPSATWVTQVPLEEKVTVGQV